MTKKPLPPSSPPMETAKPSDKPAVVGACKAATALDALSVMLICGFLYVALLFMFEVDYFLPYDSGFAAFVVWAGAVAGGKLATLAGLPDLLGMLCAGILLKNCGDLARDLPTKWGEGIRGFGLMVILMRGGLEMDFGAVRRLGFCCVRLTVLPGVSEAFASAALACAIFDMPFFLALAMGFILGAVSPAVVVGGMFNLQSGGYGVEKGIPSLVVAAASFDDVVAISGFSMFIGLAIGSGDVLKNALHGPQEIGLGLVGGLLGGLIMSMTKLWNTSWKRSAALLFLGVSFVFSAKYSHFAGAGALASLIMAGATGQFWAKGIGGPLSLGPQPEFSHRAEKDLNRVWQCLAQPMLFGVIGSALDFSKVDAATVPKALTVIIGGVIIRCSAAFFALCGAGLTLKERAFVALAWMPKATVQAALGSVPLDVARQTLNEEDDPALYAKYVQHGTDIISIAVFSILVTAPLGLIIIQQLGPRWLQQLDRVEEVQTSDDKADLREWAEARKQVEATLALPELGASDSTPDLEVADLSPKQALP